MRFSVLYLFSGLRLIFGMRIVSAFLIALYKSAVQGTVGQQGRLTKTSHSLFDSQASHPSGYGRLTLLWNLISIHQSFYKVTFHHSMSPSKSNQHIQLLFQVISTVRSQKCWLPTPKQYAKDVAVASASPRHCLVPCTCCYEGVTRGTFNSRCGRRCDTSFQI